LASADSLPVSTARPVSVEARGWCRSVREEAPFVVYRLMADLVVLLHLLFIAFVAVGSLLTVRWPRLVVLHVPVVIWAAAIVTIGFTCPLTPLEKALRRRAGASLYDGGFVDHYLDGVVYPGRYTTLARMLVAALIVAGYIVLLARRRHPLTAQRTERSTMAPLGLTPAAGGPASGSGLASLTTRTAGPHEQNEVPDA
jgi:hypothetical protein